MNKLSLIQPHPNERDSNIKILTGFSLPAVIIAILFLVPGFISCTQKTDRRIFDIHVHGDQAPEKQMHNLEMNGVYKVALSTSWELQQQYKAIQKPAIFYGLMFPCPNGIVPYSKQPCFADGKEWPDINWVEQQIKEGKLDFLGEVLTQYHGISASDTLMFPYYALAEKYDLPVGIHTGSAGPNHGCPNFKEELGDPELLTGMLEKFPKLRVWIMHAGGPFVQNTISMMKKYPELYADISAINNPKIITPAQFASIMKLLIDAGLENRIMFGSDNGDIKNAIASVDSLSFLSEYQKEKIFYKNAEFFFKK